MIVNKNNSCRMKSTYIIGEIGQNHNGSVDIAKLIVDLVSRPVREEVFNLELRPMDAVKMTKRDLNEELTDSQMNRPYDSPHSFGRTYGEHRAYLELTDEEPLSGAVQPGRSRVWYFGKEFSMMLVTWCST